MPVILALSGCSAVAPDGTTTYTGTITGGDVIPSFPLGKYAGAAFTIAGFTVHPENNGTFLCVASSATTLKLKNPNGKLESHSATASVSWLLACKELGGTVYITRLTQTQDDHIPGIPTPWQPVGPGLRPSVQSYSGNGLTDTQFILTFDYLSHLVCRIFDITSWPPANVNPVTFNPTSIELPEDALALKLLSANSTTSNSYYFNPVLIQAGNLFFDPITNTYSTTITVTAGWVPLYLGSATPSYRVYRRSIGSLPWTLIQDWQDNTLSFTDSNVGSFRYEYTATWGTGIRISKPNVNTDHNEGVIGGGNVVRVDSTTQPLDYTVSSLPGDSLNFGVTLTKQSTNATFFGDPKIQFAVVSSDEVISLSKASIGNSTNAAPTGGLGGNPEFALVPAGDDSLIPLLADSPPTSGAALLQTNANAARAGMY